MKTPPLRTLLFACTPIILTACGSGGGGSSAAENLPAQADSYLINEGETLQVDSQSGVLQNDGNNLSGLRTQPLRLPQSGSLVLAEDGGFTYTHNGGSSISDSFTYQLIDATGLPVSAATEVLINVQTVNDKPIAGAQCVKAPAQQNEFSAELPVSDEESGATGLLYSLEAAESVQEGSTTRLGNRVRLNGDGTFSYQITNALSSGWDDFTYYLQDGEHTVSNTVRVVLPTLRIMPFGDSITRGLEFVSISNDNNFANDDIRPSPSLSQGYRLSLHQQLTAQGYTIDYVGGRQYGSDIPGFDPDTEGHPGLTPKQLREGAAVTAATDERLAAGGAAYRYPGIEAALTQNPPDVILLHAGTNDINNLRPTSELQRLLESMLEWQNTEQGRSVKIALATLVPSYFPNRNNAQAGDASDFNQPLPSFALDHANVWLAEMETALAPATGLFASGDFGDGIHPNAIGYEKMAQVWLDTLTHSDHGALRDLRQYQGIDCQ